jgi:predicted  nucleic acid-binding Zn-ribbon protein
MDEEYEILPHKLLEDLKYDVEALKEKLSEPETATRELIAEMEDLRSTVKELNNIFKVALQDLKEEDSTKLLTALQNKIETVSTQNETIARGMVAISDKLEDFMKGRQPALSLKTPHSIPRAASRMPPSAPSLGPPPPPRPQRKSIFK